ncbi:MAG: InlB B-repeat-containing protein, partial [Lachnospiraceae bacterium]|nr:InlB B-repeat-containing protein [Lachnospiraceae bacterium]
RKQKVDPVINSSPTYDTELNLKIIDFMKSNDNSTQWVNNDNTLWSDMGARRNILYEVFNGFKPRIVAVPDAYTIYPDTPVYLRVKFYTYWNGITKERRDREKEYLGESVGETTPEACTGTARLIEITEEGSEVRGEAEIVNGEAVFPLTIMLETGTHKLRVDYDGDSYNGSAKSNVVEVTKETNSVLIVIRWVTFRVVNGEWDDAKEGEERKEKRVLVSTYIAQNDIPTVGNHPDEGYTAGSWDVTPIPNVYLPSDVTYTYTYAPIPDYPVTYRVVNGTWADGTTKLLTESVRNGSSPSSVPVGMIPAEGYTGGSWNTDPASATITGPASFVYSFDPVPAYEVTYKVVNGTWEDGSSSDITEKVYSGSYPSSVPEGMIASEGYRGGTWDTDPSSAAITQDAVFTYTFEKIKMRTVTFDANGHGTAPGAQMIEDGKTALRPSDPSENGWTFGGWYLEEACTNAFDFSTPVTADITLYAKWNKASEAVYTVVAGSGSIWTKGSTTSITITVKRSIADDTCFSHFTGVRIDGTALDADDYEAKAGSTVVTLNDSALEKLSAGRHIVTISFDDGMAETDLTVEEDPNLPNTGDNSSNGFWTAMLAVSFMCLCITALSGRKRRS